MSGRRATNRSPRFDVWPTPVAVEDLKSLRGPVREAVKQARMDLEKRGCQAAHYRLEDDRLLESICIRRLPHNYRMAVAFPSENEVVILMIGEHFRRAQDPKATTPSLDFFARLYGTLGLTVPLREGRRPPCCEDGRPPVDPDLLDHFIARSRELIRQRRRRQE